MSKTNGKKAASAEPKSTPPAATNTSEATGQAGAAGTLPGATPPAAQGATATAAIGSEGTSASPSGGADAAPGSETSSIFAASDLAAGAAGGENAGTNTSSAPDGREVVTDPQAGQASPAAESDTRDSSANPANPPAGEADRRVIARVKAGQARGIWRGGRFWPADLVDVREGELTDEQWALVRGEAKLTVVEV
ncbi:hypothetical protein [Methyloversatilis discipulorum]|uniref:hypothetical protein n=1 Tax=Methyloversatilis discipulorum TaxID=1119528 RepID=UPI001A62BC3A|nr:hypothetical protein [Methyloversatilis discipulorum]MBL8467371.1 hypothetical protein [Methyloversatilis discipulorum]